jgi:hypothetical protein
MNVIAPTTKPRSMPGGKAFDYPAYKVNGKGFAFLGSAGAAVKLPKV